MEKKKKRAKKKLAGENLLRKWRTWLRLLPYWLSPNIPPPKRVLHFNAHGSAPAVDDVMWSSATPLNWRGSLRTFLVSWSFLFLGVAIT
jgi:hypothetical protein